MEGVIYVQGATRNVGMDTTVITIADLLKDDGYTTGIFGKWHLGYKEVFNPVNNCFDEFIGYRSGNIDYHTHYDNAGIFDWYHNKDTLDENGYVTSTQNGYWSIDPLPIGQYTLVVDTTGGWVNNCANPIPINMFLPRIVLFSFVS